MAGPDFNPSYYPKLYDPEPGLTDVATLLSARRGAEAHAKAQAAQLREQQRQHDMNFKLMGDKEARLVVKEKSDEDFRQKDQNEKQTLAAMDAFRAHDKVRGEYILRNGTYYDPATGQPVRGVPGGLTTTQTNIPRTAEEIAGPAPMPGAMTPLPPPELPVAPEGKGGYAPNVQRAHNEPHARLMNPLTAAAAMQGGVRPADMDQASMAALAQRQTEKDAQRAAVADATAGNAQQAEDFQAAQDKHADVGGFARTQAAIEKARGPTTEYHMGAPGPDQFTFSEESLRKPQDHLAHEWEQKMRALAPDELRWNPKTGQREPFHDPRYDQLLQQGRAIMELYPGDPTKGFEKATEYFMNGQKAWGKPETGNAPLTAGQQIEKAAVGARVAAQGKANAPAFKPTDIVKELTELRKDQFDKPIATYQQLARTQTALSGNNPVSQKLATLRQLYADMHRLNEKEIEAMGGAVSGLLPHLESIFSVAEAEGLGSTHLAQLLDEAKAQVDDAGKIIKQRGEAVANDTFSDASYDQHRNLINSHIRSWFTGAGMAAPTGTEPAAGGGKAPLHAASQGAAKSKRIDDAIAAYNAAAGGH